MPERIVVVGAGGFAREVMDIIEDLTECGHISYEILGAIDPMPSESQLARLHSRGVRYLGDDDSWLQQPNADRFVVALGDPVLRSRVVPRYLRAGVTPATLIHPSALVGRHTTIEEGAIVCAGAVISTNVRLSSFATVNPNATIGHDATIGEFVSVNPGAIISGDVSIGERTLIGAGAIVLENLSVAADCIVGAGACVTKQVFSGTTVIGVPARPFKFC